ncbi:MAG: DUF420 domain-containing protein [Nannocystaceae bacterium]
MPQVDLEKKYKKWITAISIVIPLTIATLFGVRIEGYDLGFLPPIYAAINAVTSLVLLAAVVCITRGQRLWHERLMKSAVWLSTSFLLMYVAYHVTSESTPYGGSGWIRSVYFTLLVSHILLSIVVLPFVLSTYVRAWAGNFDRHRKLARLTFPLWLYVTVSGVLVYCMISPYYPR